MFGWPLSSALAWVNVLYLVSLGLTLFLSVTLWRVSVAAQTESDAQLERYKAQAASEVAQAGADAAKAKEQAAIAEQRAAEAKANASAAQLETERIKQTVSWRTVNDDLAKRLIDALSKRKGSINLRYTGGDPEALFFAIQLSRILQAAGWSVAPGESRQNAIIFGILLTGPDGESRAGLSDALTETGMPFQLGDLPQTGSSVEFNTSRIPNAPTLVIGSRQPPQFP